MFAIGFQHGDHRLDSLDIVLFLVGIDHCTGVFQFGKHHIRERFGVGDAAGITDFLRLCQFFRCRLQFGDDGLRITDNEGEIIEITTDGIKIGGEDFINYTTERSPDYDAITFKVGGVTIRLEETIKSAEEE